MKIVITIILFSLSLMMSCKAQTKVNQDYFYNSKKILGSRTFFFEKYYPLINLDLDYQYFDEKYDSISKVIFLDSLLTGSYLPLLGKGNSKNDNIVLYKFSAEKNEEISNVIKSIAYYAKSNFIKEGKTVPQFAGYSLDSIYVDLNEKKDRYLVLKCWFINCTQCIAEFPVLNELVKKYKSNKNLEFISLAFESPKELRIFLNKNNLLYQVLPNMKMFLTDNLKISVYPSHLIIRNGIIIKVFSTAQGVANFLSNKLDQ